MSYNGSGTFQINSSGQPVITGTVISSTAFNALTADLATGLSTAITKDGQTTTTSRILFAQGISSTLTTDATSTTTGSIITAGGISTQKALWVGTTSNFAGTMTAAAANFSGNLSVVNSGATASISIGSASNTFHQQINFLNSVSAVSGSIDYFPNSGLLTISPSVSTTFTGLVGIGMTPSNVLDITKNAAGAQYVNILNSNAGTSASAGYHASNGTSTFQLDQLGATYTTSGVFRQNGTLLYGDGAGGLTIDTGAAQPIYFGINNTEAARFGSDGSFLIGSTTNLGAGNMSAKSYIVRSTVAAVNGTSQITAVRTASVSTSATTIYAMGDYGYLLLITGDNGGNGFTDLVISGYGSSVTVISSTTAYGSPAARTYSNSSGNLQLAMASSTYSVAVIAVQSGRY